MNSWILLRVKEGNGFVAGRIRYRAYCLCVLLYSQVTIEEFHGTRVRIIINKKQ